MSAFTVKVSIHCQCQHSLPQSAFTAKVSVDSHVSIHLRLRTPRIIQAAIATLRWMGKWTVFLF